MYSSTFRKLFVRKSTEPNLVPHRVFLSGLPHVTDRNRVLEIQSEVFLALEQHVRDKLYAHPDRFADISSLIDSFVLVASELASILEDEAGDSMKV